MELDTIISSYKHKISIQIRFKDIDKQGHVNNANHLTYFEIARTGYFKDVFRKGHDWIKTGMILASVQITYKQPILLEQDLYCFTKVSRIGTKSFDMENVLAIKTPSGMELCAFGKSTIVCMDYESKKTITVPQEWKNASNEFESNPIM